MKILRKCGSMWLGVQVGMCRCVCFTIDLRTQVLNYSNEPEKLKLSEKVEVTQFEARMNVFLT